MLSGYARIFERHRPYVVATAALRDRFDETPLGCDQTTWIDPMRAASGPFLDLVHRLDMRTFGPLGMTMPRWALYDCGQLPGGVFGLGSLASEVRPRVKQALQVPDDYEGLIPMSMYIAIPTLEPDCWLGHSICSLNEVSFGVSPPGMRLVTMALAVASLNAKTIVGTTQWMSPKLSVYARFAPLSLQAAWMPAHSEPDTCVFHFSVTEARLRQALGPPESLAVDAERLDVGIEENLQNLQAELEAGQNIDIVGPPIADGSVLQVPIRRSGRV